jgi:hypothetical protein
VGRRFAAGAGSDRVSSSGPLSRSERRATRRVALLIGDPRIPSRVGRSPGRLLSSFADHESSALHLGDRPAESRQLARHGDGDKARALALCSQPLPGALKSSLSRPGRSSRAAKQSELAREPLARRARLVCGPGRPRQLRAELRRTVMLWPRRELLPRGVCTCRASGQVPTFLLLAQPDGMHRRAIRSRRLRPPGAGPSGHPPRRVARGRCSPRPAEGCRGRARPRSAGRTSAPPPRPAP